MTDLVEDVARAVAAADLDANMDNWHDWVPEARAAISVIAQRLREPMTQTLLNELGSLRALADHLEA